MQKPIAESNLGMSSYAFKIKNELRQGGAMSPVLINLALQSVIKKVLRTESLVLRDKNITFACANNIVIIGKIQEEMKKKHNGNDESRKKYWTKS